MNTWDIQILTGMMVFIRAITFLSLIPFFGGDRIPLLLKISIAAGIALILHSDVQISEDLVLHWIYLILLSVREATLGFIMSFTVYMVFFSVELATQIIANEIGFSMSTSLDPLSSKVNNVLESLFIYFVIIVFFISDTHQNLLLAFKKSFIYFPITIHSHLNDFENLFKSIGQMFCVGLQIATPIMGISFLSNIAFAVLGKAAQKINVFMISFAVKVLVGLSMLLFTTHLILQYINKEVLKTPERILYNIGF